MNLSIFRWFPPTPFNKSLFRKILSEEFTWLLNDDLLCATFSWAGKCCLGGVLVSVGIFVGVAKVGQQKQKSISTLKIQFSKINLKMHSGE